MQSSLTLSEDIAASLNELRGLGYDKSTLDRVVSELAGVLADHADTEFSAAPFFNDAGVYDVAAPALSRPGYVLNHDAF